MRACMVARIESGPDWGLSIRFGGSGAHWVPVRSRRERIGTWTSLTDVRRFAESVRLSGFSVER